MRALAVLLLLFVTAAPVQASEPLPRDRVFVVVETEPARPFVHQPFRIALTFGVERDWFPKHAIQLFRQELDVPVQIEAPWVGAIAGLDPVSDITTDRGARFALNGGAGRAVSAGTREIQGRSFDVYRVEQVVVAPTSGPISLVAPTLRFAYATAFEADFVGGRVPLDRKDVRLQGAAHTIEVRALPDAKRPPAFVDAVGQLQIVAETDRDTVEVGERFVLRVTIRGRGNVATLTPPDLRALDGLHVYGVERNLPDDESLRLRADVAVVRDDVTQVPPIPFAYFDPGPPSGYVVVRTQPQPLRVTSTRSDTQGASTAPDAPASMDKAPTTAPWWLYVLSILLAVAMVAYAWLRSRGEEPFVETIEPAMAMDASRVREARAAMEALDASADVQARADVVTELIAAHLGCPRAAVVRPDLAERLRGHGLDAALSERAARSIEALVAARYGGPPPAWDQALALALLDGLSD